MFKHIREYVLYLTVSAYLTVSGFSVHPDIYFLSIFDSELSLGLCTAEETALALGKSKSPPETRPWPRPSSTTDLKFNY